MSSIMENNVMIDIDPFNLEGMITLYNFLDTLILKDYILSTDSQHCRKNNTLNFMSGVNTLYIHIVSNEKTKKEAKTHFSHFMHDLVNFSEKLNEAKNNQKKEKEDAEQEKEGNVESVQKYNKEVLTKKFPSKKYILNYD